MRCRAISRDNVLRVAGSGSIKLPEETVQEAISRMAGRQFILELAELESELVRDGKRKRGLRLPATP